MSTQALSHNLRSGAQMSTQSLSHNVQSGAKGVNRPGPQSSLPYDLNQENHCENCGSNFRRRPQGHALTRPVLNNHVRRIITVRV
eukprot:351776-Chlamydomonas_euryale.AAC.2